MTEQEYGRYLNMMHQWLINKHAGNGLDNYLISQGKNKIAIYGMGIYGRHLVRELQNTDITILYGIDRQDLEPYRDISILHLDQNLPRVDAIVNTVILEHAAIKKDLDEILGYPVISLEELVFESYG